MISCIGHGGASTAAPGYLGYGFASTSVADYIDCNSWKVRH